MLKNNFFTSRLFWLLCLMVGIQLGHAQTRSYRTSSTNLVRNSTFQGNTQSTTVPDWTFDPPGDASRGWRKENSLIYGEYIAIDRVGSYTATPTLSATPCPSSPKVVKFFFNEENTGPYTFTVRLGTQVIATFTNNGLAAQSNFTLGTGVSGIVDRKFISEGLVNDTFVWNNIWHEVELYVPNYTGGNLTFEYTRTGGISRKVRLDNVELYEAIPTPVASPSSVNLVDCTTTTYNLTTLQPTGIINGVNYDNYTYSWSTSSTGSPILTTAQAQAAPIGTYYLFATPSTSCGNNTINISFPSGSVKVNPNPSCVPVCDQNQVKDGSFNLTETSNDQPAFQVPLGDNANGGGQNWKRNFTDRDDLFHVADSYTADGNSSNVGTTPLTSDNMLVMKYQNLGFPRKIYQENSSICRTGQKIIKFRFAVADQRETTGNEGPFGIYLGPPPLPGTYYGSNTSMPGLEVARLYYDGNNYGTLNVLPGRTFSVQNVAAGVTVKINGTTATVGSGSGTSPYPWKVWYEVEITVPEALSLNNNAFGGIGFLGDTDVTWLIDDVSVTVQQSNPLPPRITAANVACGGTYNLVSNANPTNTNFTYEWYEDAAGTIPVTNPSAASLGTATTKTFYLKTLNCINCGSISPTALTLTSQCGFVSGKIFADYDGPSTNGISTPEALGMSGGGLFAHLVNSSNQVANSVKVNTDGTYVLSAAAGTGYTVLLNNVQLANGTTAPANATLNPNYLNTASSIIGTTNPSTNTNGKSPVFTLVAATTISGANFGLNSPPIASDAKGEECAREAGTVYQMPTLYGVDDNPNFNNGLGQTVYVKTLSQTGGTLKYNGIDVTANSTLTNYDPTLLTFTVSTSGEAAVNFTYTFIDAAGAESQEAGVVSYSFVPKPLIFGGSVVAVGGALVQDATIKPGTWSSTDNAIATVNAETGLITGVSAGKVTINYTSYIGCSTTREIEVTAAACLIDGVIDAANTYPSLTGVTNLNKTVDNTWPNNRQSAHLVIESNSTGFVINRVENPESTITDPKEGMLVYDTTVNCFKVNTTGTSAGWKCLTTPTCPTN